MGFAVTAAFRALRPLTTPVPERQARRSTPEREAPAGGLLGYGWSRIFTAPSCLFWKISYASGAWSSGILWEAKSSTPRGSEGARRRGRRVSGGGVALA